ncbi:MAG: S-methyl-5'-thioadenosine phosphorylase [Acidimicrobiia bacterium]|nr:S-methyl-5'-thioadenosine phosphorylase [Acidimicrobiia bacterium]
MSQPLASIGVFGGSGLYSLLEDVEEVTLDTPYGATSAPLHLGTVEGRRVAFLPRHGAHHEHPAHRVNYRANMWAMKEAGARTILAPCSAGSLQVHVEPGHFVVLDQFVDRTSGRADTFFDEGANHTTMAHPYDRAVGAVLAEACRAEGVTVHEDGTVVVVQGPRFSTRAESRWFGQMGWDVVNMTQYPEAALANEAGIPYAGLALVTDYDAGLEGRDDIEPVTMEQVFAFFTSNIERVRNVLFRAMAALPA